MKTLATLIINALLHLQMKVTKYTFLRSVRHDARHPDLAQENVLRQILQKNSHTEFGRNFDFATIKSSADFRARIPIHGYEELRPYIEKQMAGNTHSLTAMPPLMYAQTSGTTGKSKYIPILPETVASYKRAQRISSCMQYHQVPGIFSGKLLAIVSPAIEGYIDDGTPDGVPYGAMSGLVYQNMPSIILTKYVLPVVIFEIEDYESKYVLIAAFALRERDISCIATANPSTLIRISETINTHFESILRFIGTGNLSALNVALSGKQLSKLMPYCRPDPRRAHTLAEIKDRNGALLFRDIWPALKGIVTWKSGNCKLLLPKLEKQIQPETRILEMGYLSSEFRGTITMDCLHNLGIPTLQDNFFEFAEINHWENGNRETVPLSNLEQGKQYYIIVTAAHGLYRYFINDIIEVTGRFEKTPTIAFVQKGKGITNLTGEKLYESQVIQAVLQTALTHELDLAFFMMLADQQDFSYTLYLESDQEFDCSTFAHQLNTHLGALNIEYLSKVKSGRIKSATIERLKGGTYEAYKAACLQAGQREGQFKIVKLQYRSDTPFPFEEHIAS